MKELPFIDLFAGIGGTRLGLELAARQLGVPMDCVLTSEWDKFAQKTYFENFNEMPLGNIKEISNREIPAHELLVAGFPCQPFSIAGVSKKNALGRAHGFECEIQG